MGFELVPVERTINRKAPKVSLSTNHFNFNSFASKIIDLEQCNARLYVDEENRKIKFEFVSEPADTDKNIRGVFGSSNKSTYRMSSNGLQSSYRFIKKYAIHQALKKKLLN